MNSIVLDLQRDALDAGVPISAVLRKALVVARKLGILEFEAWIEQELTGYTGRTEIPEYRHVIGQVRAWNPYNGWIPVGFEAPDEGKAASHRTCAQSVAEIESLVNHSQTGGELHMPFPEDVRRSLCRSFGFQTEVTLFVPAVYLVRVLDAVRTVVLNWSLKLEQEGILGYGMAFTRDERSAAGQGSYAIANFYGPVYGAQLQQQSSRSLQVGASSFDMEELQSTLARVKERLDDLGMSDEDTAEAQAELETLEVQMKSPKPKQPIIRESLRSLRRVLEGASGGLAAQLVAEIARMLG